MRICLACLIPSMILKEFCRDHWCDHHISWFWISHPAYLNLNLGMPCVIGIVSDILPLISTH